VDIKSFDLVDVVHSVNIMIAILIGGVCYYLYYIFTIDQKH